MGPSKFRKLQITNGKLQIGGTPMTITEIETLIEDTKRLARAADKVAQATALGVLEVARQLSILNDTLAKGNSKTAKAGK
jgi:hypothetical protein